MKEWIKKNQSDLILIGSYVGTILLLIILAVVPQYKVIGSNLPYNNTAINIGPGIQWYAIFIVTGLSFGVFFSIAEVKRLGWKTEIFYDGLLIIAPLAILGTRAYYLIFDENSYSFAEFFQVFFRFRDGGLAIHGAIIVATIGVIIYSKVRKINVFLLVDVLAIGLLLGQIAGRWGNFMNAEAHGGVVGNNFIPSILPNFIKHQMQFDGYQKLASGIYHPTFLYESLWNFTALIILLVLRRKKIFKTGDMIGFYLIWYGVGRSFLEYSYRTDQLKVIFNFLPVNVLLSIVLLAGGGVLYLILKRVFIKDQSYYVDNLVKDLNYPWEKINEID